eukprot:1309710-Rhodomonas_salina.1
MHKSRVPAYGTTTPVFQYNIFAFGTQIDPCGTTGVGILGKWYKKCTPMGGAFCSLILTFTALNATTDLRACLF